MHSLKNISLRDTLILLSFSFFSFLFTLSYAHAASAPFSPLIGLPGITDMKTATLPQYINALYLFLIGFGSLVAVVRIAWAGVKYSLDGVVTHKAEAKEQIKGVLLGLAILLIPYIVLNTINPELTSLNVLKLAPKVNLPADDSKKLTSAQTKDLNDCESQPGKVYDSVARLCKDIISTADDLSEFQRLCGKTNRVWNTGNTPPTCDDRPTVNSTGGTLNPNFDACIAGGSTPDMCVDP